jgi:hypothetical protein
MKTSMLVAQQRGREKTAIVCLALRGVASP